MLNVKKKILTIFIICSISKMFINDDVFHWNKVYVSKN